MTGNKLLQGQEKTKQENKPQDYYARLPTTTGSDPAFSVATSESGN